jgi:PIN domain nuclease of toxin-antitoxin system
VTLAYLADTHIVLWAFNDDPKLLDTHREVLDSNATIYVSMASVWELSIKASIGKLQVDGDLLTMLPAAKYTLLPIEVEHIQAVRRLPHHHRDPFDRILIAQAITESLTLLTVDRHFRLYGIATA